MTLSMMILRRARDIVDIGGWTPVVFLVLSGVLAYFGRRSLPLVCRQSTSWLLVAAVVSLFFGLWWFCNEFVRKLREEQETRDPRAPVARSPAEMDNAPRTLAIEVVKNIGYFVLLNVALVGIFVGFGLIVEFLLGWY